jgi:hypothetical protein
VDRAGLVVVRVLDHRAGFHHQHLAIDQADGDGVSGTREDTGVGLSGHGHSLGGRVLIQTFEVGEPDGLEFIESDTDGLGLQGGTPNRPKAPPF